MMSASKRQAVAEEQPFYKKESCFFCQNEDGDKLAYDVFRNNKKNNFK